VGRYFVILTIPLDDSREYVYSRRMMRRRLQTTKLLVATLGVGVVSHIGACSSGTTTDTGAKDGGADVSTSGNLMGSLPPDGATLDVVTSGNLMGTLPDASDAGVQDAQDLDVQDLDVVTSGNLMGTLPDADAADNGG
jgi:hypothetical protein